MTRKLVAGAIVAWATALVAAHASAVQTPGTESDIPVRSEDELLRLLPPAPGRETVLRVCASQCHAADRVSAHAGGRDDWERVVQEMTLHGAQVTRDEQDEIVAYLADQLPTKVDINLLNERLLETRLNFTPQEAAAIVNWRTTNGPFRSIEQLMSVPGLTAERVKAVSRRLLF